ALLADDQQTRGLPVETVRQLQELGLWPGAPQLLDDTETDAAAAVHGNTGRIVDDKDGIVLVNHGKITRRRRRPVASFRRTRRYAHRRYPDLIAQLQAIVRPNPAFIDPHLAAAQNAIDVTVRHPF